VGSKSIQYGVGILNKSLFSSTTGEWETPMDFFNKLDIVKSSKMLTATKITLGIKNASWSFNKDTYSNQSDF